MLTGHSPLLGMIKPSKHSTKSHAELRSMLPADIRTIERFAPTQHGTMEEFQANLPIYEQFARELADAGADLIHVEGTPVSFILGRDQEGETIDRWQQQFGIPVFTSATCQVNALRVLGVTKMVDAGYDPTTGPPAERYFSAAGFAVLHVEKVPVAWAGTDEIADDEAFDMLANLVRRHPGADGLCLQGSSKWALNAVVAKLENEFGISVVHPLAARYWELMHRLGRTGPLQNRGRLLAAMPPLPSGN